MLKTMLIFNIGFQIMVIQHVQILFLNEETKESDAIDVEEEDEEKDGKKRKLGKHMKMPSTSFATKDYISEFSFKTSPNKMGKPHSKSSTFKPVPEVTKKNTVEKKLENVEKMHVKRKTILILAKKPSVESKPKKSEQCSFSP
jgi:hypothetical protein